MTTLTHAGRYELHDVLGRGSMGVVYRAHDPMIGRDVAIKVLQLSEAGTGMSRQELTSRFQAEARAAGLLTHPNIVVVYDAGEHEGNFYIAMELVVGRSLQALLDAGSSFQLPRIVRIMEQVCSALDFAHQHRIVHRDIKPANLVLTDDDTVKVTDFGTAKIMQFGTAQTTHAMGTPSYMSPEQVKGTAVDGRADIFSLGVILYELVTGEKPFPGQNITTVIYKIINEEPVPPRSLDSQVHPGIAAVIARCLAKDPAARFQTCHEMFDALKNFRKYVVPITRPKVLDDAVHTRPQASRSDAGHVAAEPQAGSVAPVTSIDNDDTWTAPQITAASITSEKNLTLAISLFLVAMIAFAGYRVWPAGKYIWSHMHTGSEASSAPTGMPSSLQTNEPMVTPAPGAEAIPTNTPDAQSTATSGDPRQAHYAARNSDVKDSAGTGVHDSPGRSNVHPRAAEVPNESGSRLSGSSPTRTGSGQ